MTKPMTPDELKEIKARCDAAKSVPAHCKRCKWFIDLPACTAEIERLRGLAKSAYFEGMVFGCPDRLNPCESAWANSEACKAVEAK